MADEGPTTAVTLIAKFKGDDSDVMESIRRVKAAAVELGATDIDVKVETSGAAKAVADLEAVKAATDRLDTSDERLFTTQQKVSGQNQKHLQQWQAITLAVFALLPLFGPLLGYSVAVAGALTAMGVSGIAALYGIKQEMERGTATGNEYAAGIQVLKQDLNELGHTSAVAMLSSYDRVLGMIQERMPELNTDTRLFSTQLGVAGTLLVSGVLGAFQQLVPLLLTGGVYIEQIALGFERWANGDGVQKFGNYALNVLPQVADTVGQLAKLVLDVVTAAAPWGSVMLGAIRAVAQVLDTFPAPVLGVIAAGAIAGYTAFRLWNAVTGGIGSVKEALVAVNNVIKAHLPLTQAEIDLSATYTALLANEAGVAEAVAAGEADMAVATTAAGTAFDAATGPIGVAFAVLGALAAIISVVVSSTSAAADATDDYTAAVQQDSGAIGENVRAQAASNLQKDGAFAAAKRLGIATNTLTDAALGGSTAQEKLAQRVAQTKGALELAADVARKASADTYKQAFATEQLAQKHYDDAVAAQKAAGTEADSIKTQIKAYNELQDALGGTHIKTQAQFDAQVALAKQYGLSLPAFVNATDAQKKQEDAAADTTAQLRLENDAATLLKNALDLLNGKALSVAEAQTGLAAANNSVVDSFKQNKTEIDGTSKAAVANQQAIQASVEAAQQYAEAVGTQTGSSEKARQALIDSKQAMEDTLKSQGLLTQNVQDYIDKIFQIPASVPPTKLDVDDAAAVTKIQSLQAMIDRLANTKGVIGYQYSTQAVTGYIAPGNAAGGTIRGFADGGSWGTVRGPGSTTSDSIITRLSLDEEVIRASSARQVRPLLKAINKDPKQAVADVMAVGAAAGSKVEKHSHLHIDGTGYSPDSLFAEFTRRENLGNA